MSRTESPIQQHYRVQPGRVARCRRAARRRQVPLVAAGLVLVVVLVDRVVGLPAGSWPGAAPPGSDEPAIFADDFSGWQVNTAKWQSGYHWGDTNEDNKELQCYTPDALAVGGGVLRITARREPTRCNGRLELPYSSGMVTTYGSFAQKHGYFEMRAKLPAGQGLWPAFWLLPRERGFPPEIDVVEHLGDDPRKVHMHFHYRDGDGRLHKAGTDWSGPDFTAGFHRFAVSWNEDEIIWFVDGVERFRVTENIPEEPMYLLVNLAVGGEWPGEPDAATTFPSVMEIDWVRVWEDPDFRPR